MAAITHAPITHTVLRGPHSVAQYHLSDGVMRVVSVKANSPEAEAELLAYIHDLAQRWGATVAGV